MSRMTFSRSAFALLLGLAITVPCSGQTAVENIVVAGEVTKLVLCSSESGVWIYNFSIRLHAKNIGTKPLIMSSHSAVTDYYKIGATVSDLSSMNFSHIGWVTSGGASEPTAVSKKLFKPFKVVPPNQSIDIQVDLRAAVMDELKPGSAYLQIVAENWPGYSDTYVAKLRHAWSSYGQLWVHSLHSEVISFAVPDKPTKVRCP